MRKGQNDWADYIVELGYATIIVDSFAGRDIITLDDKMALRRGKLMGRERSGDVLVGLNEARKLPFVDKDQSWIMVILRAIDLNPNTLYPIEVLR